MKRIREMKEITFVTSNANKLKEFRQIMGEELAIRSEGLDLPELQGTPEEVALEKAKEASRRIQGPVITEDTSLCMEAYGGLPGVYIKHFLEKLGPDGLPRMLDGFDTRAAYAQCIFGFCEGPEAEAEIFVGRTQGTIVQPRGPRTFGWDPCFEPEGFSLTYAEMDKDTKNSISHRGKAAEKLRSFLHERARQLNQ